MDAVVDAYDELAASMRRNARRFDLTGGGLVDGDAVMVWKPSAPVWVSPPHTRYEPVPRPGLAGAAPDTNVAKPFTPLRIWWRALSKRRRSEP